MLKVLKFLGFAVVLLLVLRACGANSSAPKVAEPVPAAQSNVACKDDLQARREAYQDFMQKKQYWLAANELRACASVARDASIAAMVKEAEIASYVADMESKNTSAFDKMRAYESLARDYPDEAKQHEGKRPAIQRQLDKEAAAEARRVAAEKRRQGVSIGMSKEDVLASSWGRPQKINTTTTKYGVREQWVYGSGNYLYFEDGVLTSIQN